ncbi:hypothetical protein C0J52_11154 [Blattella germanica]|nr:hypothetical protein C0J52_11154 [Blattella germanica]
MVGAMMVGSVMTWEQNTYDLTSSPISYSVSLGAIIGSINAAILVNFVGRKTTLIMASTIYFISWSLLALTELHVFLILARFASGLAIGLTSVVLPMYVSEVTERSAGGALGSLHFSMVNLGSFLMYTLQTFTLHYICIEGMFICISALFLLLLLLLPESPDFVRKSTAEHLPQHTEKSENLDFSNRTNSSEDKLISMSVFRRLKHLMFSGKNKMPLITLALLVVQTTCGLTTMKYLSSNGLVFMGSVEQYKLLFTFLLFLEFSSSVFHSYYLNYKKTRRKLLRGLCLMTCCLLELGFYFQNKWYYETGQSPAIIAIGLFLIIYNYEFGPIPWVLLCDSSTFNIKSLKAIFYSMTFTIFWTFRLLENEILREYLYSVGIHIFCFMFASTCIISIIFFKYTFPEAYNESSPTIKNDEKSHFHNSRLRRLSPELQMVYKLSFESGEAFPSQRKIGPIKPGGKFFIKMVAIGSISILTPMYLTEIADDDNRGGTGSLYFSMFTFGKIFMLALRTVPYIWYTCAPLFFPPLSLITVALAPESPSYLLYCQKFNKAKKSFLILRPEGNPRIKQEYQALEAEIEILKKKGGGFKQIFTKAPRKAFMISFFLMIFYGLCGSSQIDNFIIYFYEDNLYYILSFVNLLIQAVFSVVGGRLSDTIGRKIMLIVSAVTMAISLTVMGVYYRFGDEIGSPIPAQVFVFVFIFGYSIGFGPLPWTIVTELFPINIKWFGSSIVILVYWLVEFLFHGIYADELISLMGIDCFAWTVAGICCLSVVFIIFCLPETKGLSDGEIRQLISSKVFHHWRRHNAWNLNG